MCSKLLEKFVFAISVSSAYAVVHAGELTEVTNEVNAEPDASIPLLAVDGPEMASFYYDYVGEMDFEDESGSYNLNAFRLQSPIAGAYDDGFGWGVDVFLEYTDFNVKDQSALEDLDLYRIGMDLNFIWLNVKGSKWSPVLRLSPSLSSDFESVSTDDFRMTATAGAFYQQRSNLKWLFGIFYTNNYYSDKWNSFFMLPVVGFSWQPADCFDITALGPRIDFSYLPNDDWKIGAFFAARSRNWNTEGDNSFQVSAFIAGARLDYQVVENCWIIGEVGMTFNNSVDVYDRHDRELFSEDADAGVFASVGLRYRF